MSKIHEQYEDTLRENLKLFHKIEQLQAEVEKLKIFVRECAENYDCDEDAHTHFTTCRACEAKALLKGK